MPQKLSNEHTVKSSNSSIDVESFEFANDVEPAPSSNRQPQANSSLCQLENLIELVEQLSDDEQDFPLEKTKTRNLNNQSSKASIAPSISCEVIKNLEEFQKAKQLWGQFDTDPLNSFNWNFRWWNAFESHGDLHLVKFEQADEIVGFAPFYADRWFGLSRFRFLATGDTCTDYVDLICDFQHYQSCANELAKYIRSNAFAVVELDSPRDDRLATLLKHHLAEDYKSDHRPAEPTWRLALPDSWAEFKSTAKKSLRRKINKATRRLETNEFTITSSSEIPVEQAFQTLKELHTRRFNSKGMPGVFADPQFETFLRSAVLDFHREGKSEIVIVLHNEKPIAAHLYFNSREGYQFYQSGYAPEAMKLEPGHLLFTAMVQKAIDRRDTCFDFLRGDEPYKEYWGAAPHAQNKLRMVSKKTVPTVISKVIETGRSLLRKNT